MPLTETTHTIVRDGTVVITDEESERKLYTLRELKDGNHIEDEPSDIIEHAVSSAYPTALDNLGQSQQELWSGADDEEWLLYTLNKAGLTFNFRSASWNVGYGGTWFALPRETDVDVPVFLRAMKDFYAGIDFRRDGISPESWIVCPKFSQYKLDLRSKDARLAKENGLVVHVRNTRYESNTDEFEYESDNWFDPGYTDKFKQDANYFLMELTSTIAQMMNADYEDQTSEESLLEIADINEMRFTRIGRHA